MTRLEQLRLDARLSPVALSEKTGISHQTIRDLEAGNTARPQIRTLGTLADFFGVRPSELLLSAVPPRDDLPTAA